MKTILLTGATGFLGSHLLKKLLSGIGYKIILLKRSFSNVSRIENELKNDNVKSYDIDEIELEKIFEQEKITIIIHCATEYGRQGVNVGDIWNTNLILPVKLLELALKFNVQGFINTDSYYNKGERLFYPYLLNYSLSKKSLNLWLDYFSDKIKIINMVLEHVYGEDDSPNKFVNEMINKIAIEKVKFVNLTEGDQIRDFIYVEDVAETYLKAIEYLQNKNFQAGFTLD